MTETAPLCERDHMCPPCIDGGECMDLYVDPECGLVACMSDIPTVTEADHE
jgi:hypothetical protein